MKKLNVIELEKEYVDDGKAILKYVCPSYTKDQVKIQGGENWIMVDFLGTDLMYPQKYSYEIQSPVKSINCKFKDGILTCEIQFETPKARKLNITFD